MVETECIGDGTRISAFVHILPGARIGADCAILDHVFIDSAVSIGDRVTIGGGAQLTGSLELEDDVVVGPNAVFASDPAKPAHTTVRRGVSIGANATIMPGIVIGERAVISAGVVITRDVPTDAIVTGCAAQIAGYVSAASEPAPGATASEVRGVVLQTLPRFKDMRGALTVAEVQSHIPFPIQRFFLVYDVLSREVRGEHAHRKLHQFLVCVRGSCAVLVDDGEHRQEFQLDSPTRGLYLPPMIWSVQHQHSPDAVLLVLASAPYDPDDYVRDYDSFLELVLAKLEVANCDVQFGCRDGSAC